LNQGEEKRGVTREKCETTRPLGKKKGGSPSPGGVLLPPEGKCGKGLGYAGKGKF